MSTVTRNSLEEYLALEYPFNVIADPEGGYVIVFPDLPGCVTQAETLNEIVPMAEDARALWLEAAYEQEGLEIPLPSYPEEYSGKFNLRLPRSLHRKLAEAAEREGISLNSYAAEVLARGDAQAQLDRHLREMQAQTKQRLQEIESRLEAILDSMRYQFTDMHPPSQGHRPFEIVWESDEDENAFLDHVAA